MLGGRKRPPHGVMLRQHAGEEKVAPHPNDLPRPDADMTLRVDIALSRSRSWDTPFRMPSARRFTASCGLPERSRKEPVACRRHEYIIIW